MKNEITKGQPQALAIYKQYLTPATLKINRQITAAEAVKSPQLSKMKRELGLKATAEIVVGLLVQLKKFTKFEANNNDLFDYAELIIADYWSIKIEELIRAFKIGIKSKTYGAVTYADLCTWIEQAQNERLNYLDDVRAKNKEAYDANRNYGTQGLKQALNPFKK